MKKANILIEALISLSLVLIASSMLFILFPDLEMEWNQSNPWNYLSSKCDAICALEKALP